jgi:hypothetical protein
MWWYKKQKGVVKKQNMAYNNKRNKDKAGGWN